MITSFSRNSEGFFEAAKDIHKGLWINVEKVTKKDLEILLSLTDFVYDDIRCCLDVHEVPRIESQKKALLLFIRVPIEVKDRLFTQTLSILLSKKRFITITPGKNHLLHSQLAQHISKNGEAQQKLLLALLHTISQEFSRKIRQVGHDVFMKRNAVSQVDNDDIISLIRYEEILNQYLSALVPMESALKTVLTGKLLSLSNGDVSRFKDLLIGLSQSITLCNVNLKRIVGLRDSYQILFTNNLNKRIRFLTSLTIIVTIPTIVASIYGMNVKLPLQEDPGVFALILLSTCLFMLLAFLFFYWKKWL